MVSIDMLLQMILQMNSNMQGNANVVTQQLAEIVERLGRIEEMFKAGTQQEQEDFRSASPSPPPLLIVIYQAVIVPTPFDQSQRAPFGTYVPPTVQLSIVEEARLTKRASLYQAPHSFRSPTMSSRSLQHKKGLILSSILLTSLATLGLTLSRTQVCTTC